LSDLRGHDVLAWLHTVCEAPACDDCCFGTEVSTHCAVLSSAQAFQCMPQPVRTRLAKACQGLQLPLGAVVFEEDDKGDAMYVVVSGSLQVRARPLNPAGTAQPQPEALSLLPAQTGASAADAAAAAGSVGGAAPGKMRATADAVCAGASSSGGGARLGSQMGSSRRTTWEGAAFTAKEQTKLNAVRTALEAEKLEVRANLASGSSCAGSARRRAIARAC
jgi:hypothetical protein